MPINDNTPRVRAEDEATAADMLEAFLAALLEEVSR